MYKCTLSIPSLFYDYIHNTIDTGTSCRSSQLNRCTYIFVIYIRVPQQNEVQYFLNRCLASNMFFLKIYYDLGKTSVIEITCMLLLNVK